MDLSANWKLIITSSIPRIIHARGCDHIKDWIVDGTCEINKVRTKHNICKKCRYLVYLTIGATDYINNLSLYKSLFNNIDPNKLKELFMQKKATCFFNGERIYFKVKHDTFYIDFRFNEIHLFHANYCVNKRDHNEYLLKGGYHEHKLKNKVPTFNDAILYILFYDYKKAKEVHKKNRKKKIKLKLSEYDPETYGFKDI